MLSPARVQHSRIKDAKAAATISAHLLSARTSAIRPVSDRDIYSSIYIRTACGAGEVVFRDPNTQGARSCNQQLTNSCPTGYTCRYDSLTQNSVCCGATNEGVCTTSEKAYIEALTMSPRECLPNIAGTCPNQFQCRYNRQKGKYYCCAPLDGSE